MEKCAYNVNILMVLLWQKMHTKKKRETTIHRWQHQTTGENGGKRIRNIYKFTRMPLVFSLLLRLSLSYIIHYSPAQHKSFMDKRTRPILNTGVEWRQVNLQSMHNCKNRFNIDAHDFLIPIIQVNQIHVLFCIRKIDFTYVNSFISI